MKNHLHKSFLFRAGCLSLVFVILVLRIFSQTTNISGVVNSYHSVIDVVPDKACVRVSSTAGLAANDKVMIIQMKGVTIDLSNSAAFGDILSQNNAGNYELGTICTIIGDSVFLVNDILNSYSFLNGKVQLVRIAQYVSANVISTVTALPWNNTTGTGGVIAIFAEQDIILNADIQANAAGYRGGMYVASSADCSNFIPLSGYFYNASFTGPQPGAYKGEGAVEISPGIYTGGRGAAGNGGGGGNNHNNSGGGGANLRAGGIGGGNSSDAGCRTTLRGEAGKSLNSSGGTKIFFGGGGGAGHTNDAMVNTAAGGDGGGIIFIHAANITSNGHSITASGGNGLSAESNGAGGGGAGGTIIIDAAGYTGAVNIQANGGNGGNTDDNGVEDRCYGGGGGGSGGVVYFNDGSPAGTITINGGAAGVETEREGCNPEQPPGNGTAGDSFTGYAYRASSGLAGYCALILPVRLAYFQAKAYSTKIQLNWQLPTPEYVHSFTIEKINEAGKWTDLITVASLEGQHHYRAEDITATPGYNTYRIRINEKSNTASYSTIRRVWIGSAKETITIYPNPAKDKVIIKGNINGKTELLLRDLSGKLILRKTVIAINTVELNLPALPAGIYTLSIYETISKLVIR